MYFRKAFVWVVRKLRLLEIWYEDFRGLDFVRRDMSVKGKGNAGYEESPFYARSVIGKYLRGKISEKDSILDAGCGKGKMLYFLTKFPFGKICGLEYSPKLVEIARRNMSKIRNGGGVEIIHGDASVFDDIDRYNYFYIFNSFDDTIMKPFLRNIKASLSRTPRKIHIIYFNPLQHELLISEGFTQEQELSRGFYQPIEEVFRRVIVYTF